MLIGNIPKYIFHNIYYVIRSIILNIFLILENFPHCENYQIMYRVGLFQKNLYMGVHVSKISVHVENVVI